MHASLFFLALASQASTTLCLNHDARQEFVPPEPTTTDLFSAPAADLISRYIPSSVTFLMYAHYTSYASTTGEPAFIIESAFTALTPPAWLDTLPTEYQSNIKALESAVSMLRSEISTTDAPPVEETATAGGTGGVTDAPPMEGTATTAGTGSASRNSGENVTATSTATSAASESSLHGVLVPVKSTPSIDWGPTETSGLAKATNVPIKAIGVMGFVGMALVL